MGRETPPPSKSLGRPSNRLVARHGLLVSTPDAHHRPKIRFQRPAKCAGLPCRCYAASNSHPSEGVPPNQAWMGESRRASWLRLRLRRPAVATLTTSSSFLSGYIPFGGKSTHGYAAGTEAVRVLRKVLAAVSDVRVELSSDFTERASQSPLTGSNAVGRVHDFGNGIRI